MAKPLTKSQRKKMVELEELAAIVGVDFWNIETNYEEDARNAMLAIMKDRLVRSGIISKYLIIDELLTDIMCRHFFEPKRSFVKLWKTRRFQNFNYYIVEELSLLKKLALVKEIKRIPKSVAETIRLTNVLRNAVAHSFFPTNKREFKRTKKVTYKGKDVFGLEGLELFSNEAQDAVDCLIGLAFGIKL